MLFGAVSGKLGFRNETLEEEDIGFMQLAGMYPLNKFYSAYLFGSYVLAIFMMGGMVVGSYLDGEINFAFETAHSLLIGLNMFTQFSIYRYHYDIVDKFFRAIDNQFFSYGDTMDGNTIKMINELAKEKTSRKRIFGKLFKIQVSSAATCIVLQRVVPYLYNGRGLKDVDGENWLIYQSPVGLLFPFSSYWVPYIIGIIMSHIYICIYGLTAMASATSFVRFAEELLHQLQIVKIGLGNFMPRARHLYTLRFAGSLDSKNYHENIETCLKTCLIKLFGDFKKMMFIPLFTVIFDGSALICMSTVQLLLSENPVVRITMPSFIVAELYYTYLYCSYGEKLTNMFSEIGDQMYLDDWLAHSKVIKPYMTIIKAYTFYPKKLSAGGFTSPNLEIFGSVLRTAYSLLNFLVTQR